MRLPIKYKDNDKIIKYYNYNNVILGVFLIILSISGNFIGETMSCQIRKHLMNNMYSKNLIIILIIYFAISLTNEDKTIHPIIHTIISLYIWIIFLMFNKMDSCFTFIIIFLIIGILLLKNYIDYYEAIDNKEIVDKLKSVSKIIIISTIIIIIIGFTIYFIRQSKEHKKNFSYIKFLFGTKRCNSIK
jgi:hypothetical protein